MRRGAVIVAATLVLAANVVSCSTPTGECFNCAAPHLAITPDDLRTGEGLVTIRITVSGSSVDAALLDAVAKGAKLRTYPELVDVPFTAVPHLVTPPSSTTESQVDIGPAVTLAPSTFYVASVDPSVRAIPGPAHPVLEAEPATHAARFGTGAMPVMRGVSMNENGSVSIAFSEALTVAEATIASQLRVFDASLAPCAYVPPGIPNQPPVRLATGLSYKCTPSAYAARKVHLEFGDPLVTSSGAPLRLFDPDSRTSSGLLKAPVPVDLALDRQERGSASWVP